MAQKKIGAEQLDVNLTPQLGGNLDVNGFKITAGQDGLNGAPVDILGGNTTTEEGVGGYVNITAGTGDGGLTDAYGGDVVITGGAGVGPAGGYNGGGLITLTGGSSNYYGGDINITGGAGTSTGQGGKIAIKGGAQNGLVSLAGGGSGGTYDAANAVVSGGQASGTYQGGDAIIQGGNAVNGTAGNVKLQPGDATAGSPSFHGAIEIYGPGSSANQLAAVVRFYENGGLLPAGNNYIGLKAPDASSGTLTADRTWTLPVDDPTVAAGKFLTTDASGILSFAGQPEIIKYKATTQTKISDATLADDDDLFGYDLDASSFYLISGVLFFNSDNGTTDFKYSLTKSAATTGDNLSIMGGQSGVVGNVISPNAGGITGITTFDITSTGTRTALLQGYIETSGATTIDLQWAQGTVVATNTRLLIGSWLKFTKVG